MPAVKQLKEGRGDGRNACSAIAEEAMEPFRKSKVERKCG